MDNIKMLIEDALRGLCTEDIIEFENGEKKVVYDLDIDSSSAAAKTIIRAADLIEMWRADRNKAEATYSDSRIKELESTNRELGVDLLKSQMQLANLRKEYDELEFECKKLASDLGLESEKQTRIDIMSKRIIELESKCETYKYCFEFLAACKSES